MPGAELQARCADYPNIRMLGTLTASHLAALFRDADAVVSPTWGPEAFPLVNIEAMSCGAPVIARRSGGSLESIERTGGGLTYNEPEELLPLLDRMADDPELRKSLAAKAIAGYREHYSEERWMEQYFELIRDFSNTKGRVCADHSENDR